MGSLRGRLAGTALAAALAAGGFLLACGGDDGGLVGPSDLVIASITIDPPSAPPRVLAPGETAQLSAVATTAAGKVVEVAFTWSSSDDAVATVSSSGLVTAVAKGVVTITASAQKQSATTSIIVQVPGAQVVVEPNAPIVDVGGTVQLTATVLDAGGQVLDLPVTFSSQNAAAATVSPSGIVTGVAPGEATIVASTGEIFGAAHVTVQEPVALISFDVTTITLAVGDTVQLAATPKDGQGRALNRPMTWGSGNTTVATVEQDGRVIGRGAGTTTISASAGGKQGGISVTVEPRAVSITITGAASGNEPLMVGGTQQLTATALDALGGPVNAKVSWSSGDAGVASVDQNGLVTGVAQGTTAITASVQKLSASVDIRVAGGGGETTTGNNLSVPAIFAEGIGITGEPLATNTGLRPTAEENITVDALPFFYSANTPDCATIYYCQGGSNVWQAEWADGTALGMQSATVSWGDNLTHHAFNTHSQIRVEVRLANAGVTMTGFNMPYVLGSGSTEIQGTDGTTAAMNPCIYSVAPRLIIQKLDAQGGQPIYTAFDGAVWEKYGVDGPGGFGAEVNVGGAVIYGYNFVVRDLGLPADMQKYGWWRLTFKLDDAGQVGGVSVPRNVSLDQLSMASEEEEPPLFTPQLDAAGQTSWLDINITSASGGH